MENLVEKMELVSVAEPEPAATFLCNGECTTTKKTKKRHKNKKGTKAAAATAAVDTTEIDQQQIDEKPDTDHTSTGLLYLWAFVED